jgi:hypothetical protein
VEYAGTGHEMTPEMAAAAAEWTSHYRSLPIGEYRSAG